MKDGINTPGARSNCATVPTYDKIRSAIRNPPRFEGKPSRIRRDEQAGDSFDDVAAETF